MRREGVDELVERVLSSEPSMRAPRGFAGRIMEAVYREALRGGQVAAQPGRMQRVPARIYRRLGLSFMLTAAVLTASVFIPRAAYPTLMGTGSAGAGISREGETIVRNALSGAGQAVRGALRASEGGMRR